MRFATLPRYSLSGLPTLKTCARMTGCRNYRIHADKYEFLATLMKGIRPCLSCGTGHRPMKGFHLLACVRRAYITPTPRDIHTIPDPDSGARVWGSGPQLQFISETNPHFPASVLRTWDPGILWIFGLVYDSSPVL